MQIEQIWETGFSDLGIQLNEEQKNKLKQYVDLLSRWNKVYNLTAVRDPKNMISLHVFDSLAVADYIKGDSCLDVGSGAGLPTIPLAIIQPQRQFTALDTNGKKTRFIQQAIIELGLKNTSVEQARVEDWQAKIKFDAIISRAFSSVYDFLTSSAKHLDNNGVLYAMKGQFPQAEIQYLPKGFQLKKTHELEVPFVDGERCLIEFSIGSS